jgi:RND family efflux transporter MFP subunit
MERFSKRGWLWFLLLPCPVITGCGRSQAQQGPAPPPPPEVQVSLPETREVTDYEDFPGRMEAVNDVTVRARVTGYLEKVHFTEGADVKKGDVLFEIDPRPYKAELARAEGNVLQSQGRLKRLEADYQRATTLIPRGAMGREDFDRVVGDRNEASGALEVAKANRDMAQLNLAWTQVQAPLSGRISRRFVDPGNLVKADDTALTTIVSLDPIYASFDLDERSMLRAQRLIREGKIQWSPDVGLPVMLGLADEDTFPRQGTINFADNRVEPDTGTWRLRALFPNPDHMLAPGLFVRIRLPIGQPYKAVLIAEEALGTDQGQKFVYVVDDANRVSYRRVKVGRLHGGQRVITEGLSATDKVIVSGLQRIRQGIEVKPDVVPMPTAAAKEEEPKSKGKS